MNRSRPKVAIDRLDRSPLPSVVRAIEIPFPDVVSGHTLSQRLHSLILLFKLRIVVLLLLAGTAGAFLAAGGWPGISGLALLVACGGSAAAGASALNQYLERSSDATMHRTRHRPLVTGAIAQPGWTSVAGLLLIGIPVLLTSLINPALALWSLLGAVIYVGVYTLWLKPRTVWNIVIGGLAGSCAVLSGGAAVGAWNEPGVWGIAALLFVWTPCHFWSLAMVYRQDYARAHVPMLPVRTTMARSAGWIFLHTSATGLVALSLGLHPALGPIYLMVALPATIFLGWRSVQLMQLPDSARARRLFMASNTYLALILAAICVDVLVVW